MRIAVANDHRSYEAKRRLLPVLKKLGHDIEDFGCEGTTAVDYPDYAAPAARAVAGARCDVGILMDGSGIGMSVTANKVTGVRAALVHDEVTARRAREHNHCNVLCLGTDLLGEDQVRQIVEIFLSTGFGDGRHAKRVEKLKAVEAEERQTGSPSSRPATTGAGAAGAAAVPNVVPKEIVPPQPMRQATS